jgi:predicted nucleotidyltransferase
MPLITSFLFPEYRQRVLGLLLLHPETRYHVREIARLTNTVAGSLHRELSKLAKAQVLIREVSGNQVYYQANSTFPIFEELASILRKTSGLVDVLANALSPLAEKVAVAFVFGSMGSGTESSGSDVDVLIIGELSFADAVKALYSAQASIGREINPKIYKRTEWKKLVNNKDAFVQEILKKPKLFIIGTVNDLK